MLKRILLIITIFFSIVSISAAADLTVDEILANLQSNQSAIKDMSADTVTTITSTMKGMKSMTQKGNILMKYPDKSRVEMFEPIHQITISDGQKIMVINKDTGQKYEQEISKGQNITASGSGGLANFDKAKEMFDFSVKQDGNNYIITGLPKDVNSKKFLGKMEFNVDASRWLASKVKVYTPQGKLISESAMDYEQIAEVWVLTKTISNVSTPMGSMKMEMEYQNVKVNRGVKDSEFKS